MFALWALLQSIGRKISTFFAPNLETESSHDKPVIYLIRHGEKDQDKHGRDLPGLSRDGKERADALVDVFGKGSGYNIGLIIAQRPAVNDKQVSDERHGGKHRKKKHHRDDGDDDDSSSSSSSSSSDDDDDVTQARPLLTVKPLADSLGLTVDTSNDRDDFKGVRKSIDKFRGPGNVLVCWEHKRLTDVALAIGVRPSRRHRRYPRYPGNRFDIIWKIKYPYHEISDWTSEAVSPMDDKWKGRHVPGP